MRLRARLEKLERTTPDEGDRCPHCPPGPSLVCRYHQEGEDGEPVPTGEPEPPPCAVCGRPADVIEITEVVVSSREDVERALAAQK